MSFDTKNGTRGARQPGGWLMKTVNDWNMKRIGRKGGKIMGLDALVLTTVGRKSGEKRHTPVAWFHDTDTSWLIVASANGAAKNPSWYYNLAAHPDQAEIQLAGRTIPVTAEQLGDSERDIAWRRIIQASPRFAKYTEKTDRQIPVIRLNTRAGHR